MRSTPRTEPTPAARRASRRRTETGAGVAALALFAGVATMIGVLLPPVPDGPLYMGSGAPDDAPHYGGTFVFHHEDDLPGMDPLTSYDEISNMGLKLTFEGLIDYDEHVDFVPRIARALPEVSEDGREYTFHLRDDVRFHNGRAVTAEDVRWSMERMLSPELGSPGAVFYQLLDGYEDYRAGRAEHVRGIEVLGSHSIRFRLTQADQTFMNAMAMTFAYPVPREVYEELGASFAMHPVGTGAFVVETWEPGVRVVFRRNEDFFVPGRPYVDRMVFELNLDRGPAFMRFQNADLDHIHRTQPTDYVWLRQQERWRPYWTEYPGLDVWGLEMNCGLAPFDDVHVRRAVAFALDGARWRRARANRLLITGQPIPTALMGYDADLPGAHHFDLERAREEMRLAGHPVTRQGDRWVAEGIGPVSLWVGAGDTGRVYGELAQQDLAQIGIEVEIRQVAFTTYLTETGRPGQVQIFLGGWSADFPDPANFLDVLFSSASIHEEGSENRSFYSNPELDALLARARVERDRDARRQLYREASAIVVRDAPWAFVFANLRQQAWQPYVRYRPHPVWEYSFRDVWLDLPRQRVAQRARGVGGERFAALGWLASRGPR